MKKHYIIYSEKSGLTWAVNRRELRRLKEDFFNYPYYLIKKKNKDGSLKVIKEPSIICGTFIGNQVSTERNCSHSVRYSS